MEGKAGQSVPHRGAERDLRSDHFRAVEPRVRSGGRYVLGIDALPRGNYAAVAVGHTIAETFAIAAEGRHPLPLEERVRAAVEQAQELRGGPPAEVRLVCIDDGSDGAELSRIQHWLLEVVEAQVEVLDLVGPIDSRTNDETRAHDSDRPKALSVARAGQAALW